GDWGRAGAGAARAEPAGQRAVRGAGPAGAHGRHGPLGAGGREPGARAVAGPPALHAGRGAAGGRGAGGGHRGAREVESVERGPWLADLLFTRAAAHEAAGRPDAADADNALALSILGEAPAGPVEEPRP